MDPLYDKEIICLCCEKKYSTKRLRTRYIRAIKTGSDFFTVYKDLEHNPYLYEVHVCPDCGFSATDQFSNYFSPGAKDKVMNELSAHWISRNFGRERSLNEAIVTYKLAVFSGILKKEKHIVLAGLYLRVGWLYRIKENNEQEKRFLRLAINEYENSYQQSDFIGTQLTEIRIIYLLGELNRRIGLNANAIKYFSRVIQHREKDREKKVLEMAREQWYLIRKPEETVQKL
ncbi:hypothetical protein BTR23_19745 [Alkalihalophilus pseudofirmus]|nr:hypothetical protein BTR23_19745 [Alkalihalophilus pseudofirmus]